MRLEERAVSTAVGTILAQNVADAQGRRILKKGTRLAEHHLGQLGELGHPAVTVVILETGDVHEDEAAAILASALQTAELRATRPTGGRANLRTEVDGLLEVDAGRLLELNTLPGITLATRPNHMVVGPNQKTANVATLKIIPFAVRRDDVDRALALARPRPGIVRVRPLPPGRRVALLLVGDPAVHDKLRDAYLPPTQTRLERLGAELTTVEGVSYQGEAVGQAATRLAETSDLLIIAGQTSIMGDDDPTLSALREAGAETAISGAPVDPGNLLALAYFPQTPVLCAPGCAQGLKQNVVDLVLPRLLLGDRLGRTEIAALGLGGLLVRDTE